MWKHYVVLFGGFYDPGIKSKCELVSCSIHPAEPRNVTSQLLERLVDI